MCIRCAACSRINKGFNLFLDFPTFSIDEKVGKKSRPWSLPPRAGKIFKLSRIRFRLGTIISI